jgi:hypothetical protein
MEPNAMFALDPAAMHALSEILVVLAILIGSIGRTVHTWSCR